MLKEFFTEILPVLLVVVLVVFGSIFGLCYYGDRYGCENYEKVTGRETSFVFPGGCFVKIDSGWLSESEYKQVIIAREGLAGKK